MNSSVQRQVRFVALNDFIFSKLFENSSIFKLRGDLLLEEVSKDFPFSVGFAQVLSKKEFQ